MRRTAYCVTLYWGFFTESTQLSAVPAAAFKTTFISKKLLTIYTYTYTQRFTMYFICVGEEEKRYNWERCAKSRHINFFIGFFFLFFTLLTFVLLLYWDILEFCCRKSHWRFFEAMKWTILRSVLEIYVCTCVHMYWGRI